MHELSLVQGIIDNMLDKKSKHKFLKVNTVEIICGKYNCVSEENLQFCFDVVTKSTGLAGAKLKVSRLDDKYKCINCGNEFKVQNDNSIFCVLCKSTEVIGYFDNGIYIYKMEVEQ